jgi:hypothetical protein
MISNSPDVLNFNRLFLELNRFIYNEPPVLPEPYFAAFCSAKRKHEWKGVWLFASAQNPQPAYIPLALCL